MKTTSRARSIAGVCCILIVMVLLTSPTTASAGNIFLTGHDPDYHVQYGSGSFAIQVLTTGLAFARNGNTAKFLWVESSPFGVTSLDMIGLAGQYDTATAADIPTVNFSSYSAIAVGSDFGGSVTIAEVNALYARRADLTSYFNAGGGLLVLAEGTGVGHADAYKFLPGDYTSEDLDGGMTPTLAGSAAPFNFDEFDVNECCSHNAFGLTNGLTALDQDSSGHATTLVGGNVTIGDGGFETPEPGTLLLLCSGLVGIGLIRRRPRA